MATRILLGILGLLLVLTACGGDGGAPAHSLTAVPTPSPGVDAPSPSPTATPLPQVSQPSFAYAAPDRTIWLMGADGSGPRQLVSEQLRTPDGGAFSAAHDAIWSPDGNRLAYLIPKREFPSFAADLWVLDLHSGRRHEIDSYATELQWSPDGRYLVYDKIDGDPKSSRATNSWITDLTSPPWQLPPGIRIPIAWGADGKRIAYTGETPSPGTDISRRGYPLFVADIDGSNQRRLVDGASLIAWSPDNRLVAYWKYEHGGSALVGDICVVSVETGRELCLGEFTSDERPQWAPYRDRHIFHNLLIDAEDGTYSEVFKRPGALLSWSPDGKKVALVEGNPFGEGPRSLVVLDLASGQRTTFHTSEVTIAHAGSPGYYGEWSADGRYCAFVAYEGEAAKGSSLYVADTETGRVEPVIRHFSFGEVFPAYSPDGNLTLIQRGTHKGAAIWLAAPDGSDARKLVDGVGIIGHRGLGAWRPTKP
jgi:Tol biopolymer transport system component